MEKEMTKNKTNWLRKFSAVLVIPILSLIFASGIQANQQTYQYAQDSIIVVYKQNSDINQRQQIMSSVGAIIKDQNNNLVDDRYRNIKDGRMAKFQLPANMTPEQAIEMAMKHPAVEYAELNYIVKHTATPNDPDYGELWGLHNTGQSSGTADADIDAPEAWDTAIGDNVPIVGVIDTGVDYNHEDLAANMWTNPNEIAGNGVDDDNNGYVDDVYGVNTITGSGDPMDDNDHGTHVAGTIGAVGNNGIGVVGVNWIASIAGCKFLSAAGSGSTTDAIECIDYFVALKNAGINIVALNNSWGGGGFSQALEDSIAAADTAGIMFLAAAGNSSTDNDASPHYPSSYDVANIVAVASTDRNDALSSFSSFGLTSVDLGAPGTDILSTTPSNTYSTFSGTSMATPHVAGAAALVWAHNPTLNVAEVKDILMDSGDAISSLDGITISGRRLNVNNAIAEAGPPTPGFRLTSATGPQTVNQGETATYDIDVTSIAGFTGDVDLTTSATPALNAAVSFSVNPAPVDSTTTMSVATTTDTATGDYTITVTGVSGTVTKTTTVSLTVFAEGTVVISYPNTDVISIPDNDTTGISSTTNVPDNISIAAVDVTVNITHTWVGDLVITLTSPSGTEVTLRDRSGGSADNINETYSVTDFNGESGLGDWTLNVSDHAGADVGTLDSWTLDLTGVVDGGGPGNQAPTASFTSSTSDLIATFTDTSSDSDGSIVSWLWDFGDGNNSSSQNPSNTYASAGDYDVTLTVTDDDGATDSVTQTVTVTAAPSGIVLDVGQTRKRGNAYKVEILWSGATGTSVDVYRDGVFITNTRNDGVHRESFTSTNTSFEYQVCEPTGGCSNVLVVTP